MNSVLKSVRYVHLFRTAGREFPLGGVNGREKAAIIIARKLGIKLCSIEHLATRNYQSSWVNIQSVQCDQFPLQIKLHPILFHHGENSSPRRNIRRIPFNH